MSSNEHTLETSAKKWDVFISHASEDAQTVAIPLADWLERGGLRVWLDAHVLRIGDSLRAKIDEGLAASRFGVVIISPAFLGKHWPLRELNGLFAIEESGMKVILPVWHQVTKPQVAQISPMLSDRLAAKTDYGIREVAQEILQATVYEDPSILRSTLTGRLIEILDAGANSQVLGDFLCSNSEIVSIGLGMHGFIDFDATSGLLRSSMVMSSARHLSTRLIAFGPSDKWVRAAEKNPPWLTDLIERIKTPRPKMSVASALILAGRREFYDDADGASLRELNQSLENMKIEVRSYDVLIDAALRLSSSSR